jgi:Protein-disulfide isomerase
MSIGKPDSSVTAPPTYSSKQWIELAATVIMAVAAVVVAFVVVSGRSAASAPRPTFKAPTSPVSFANAARHGNATAKVAVIMFSEFQCPFCGRFATQTLPRLTEEFIDTGRVQLAFRHLPLGIHQDAQRAAEAAECARDQGKFWQMHDELFRSPKELDVKTVKARAATIGVDAAAFSACLDLAQTKARVDADVAAARELGINGTPLFFIGSLLPDGSSVAVKEVLMGARPYADFKAAIESALAVVGGL